MTIFKNALARFKEDDNPRLHRIPFTLIWIASYGLAWFAMFFAFMIYGDVFNQNQGLVSNLAMGLTFGVMLSLVQTWIIRRRYGFVPKFWRATTIIGAMIAGAMMPFFDYYSNSTEMWGTIFIWFSALNILQAVILFRVNRQAWLLALVGIVAGGVAVSIGTLNYQYDSEIWSVLLSSIIQAIGSSIIILRLMSNPREGIIPKRDSDEKSKLRLREGLHPMTFIGFWSATYFTGWVIIFMMVFLWYMTLGDTAIGDSINYWFEDNAEWLFWLFFGGTIGLASAIAQPWLMKQHSKVEIRHWFVFSMIGWALAGIGFWAYTEGYSMGEMEKFIYLLIWFATPTLFQTIPMWRAMRGGWIWALTGLATAIIAFLIDAQFAWTSNDTFYAIMLGGLAQAIITGSAFILLQSQQRRVERESISA